MRKNKQGRRTACGARNLKDNFDLVFNPNCKFYGIVHISRIGSQWSLNIQVMGKV